MPHKRSFEARQRRAAKRFIRLMAYYDRERGEVVNRLDRNAVIKFIMERFGAVNFGAIPRVERGEILYDSRGNGSFQRRHV